MLAAVPSKRLLVKERCILYGKDNTSKKEARDQLLKKWHNRGELDYYTTQALTGQGTFAEYLHRIGKIDSPRYWYCEQIDNAGHTIFVCKRWAELRKLAIKNCNCKIDIENVTQLLVGNKKEVTAILTMMKDIMRQKTDAKKKIRSETQASCGITGNGRFSGDTIHRPIRGGGVTKPGEVIPQGDTAAVWGID